MTISSTGVASTGTRTQVFQCAYCGADVLRRPHEMNRKGRASDNVYCSPEHFFQYMREHPGARRPRTRNTMICDGCGVEFARPANRVRGRHVYCSQACANRNMRRTPTSTTLSVGSVREDSQGYVQQKTSTGWRPQHRLVMEAWLGRRLEASENVHHVNGCRSDNRIENLELWMSGQPAGQRVADLVAWASEILAKYQDELPLHTLSEAVRDEV